jgi:hypothetical protein
MSAPVTHINLLQRSGPVRAVAWGLAGLMTATVIGVVVYGNQVRAQAQEAVRLRDDVAQQLKQVKARMAIQTGEQASSATALALSKEADALRPQAQVAQALIEAVRNAEGGRTDEFARPLTAMTGLSEPGLWLTALTVSAAGKRLELQGEARNGAAVLRFAHRANESLQPLTLRLDSLEMQPAAAGAASGAANGAVSFRLY